MNKQHRICLLFRQNLMQPLIRVKSLYLHLTDNRWFSCLVRELQRIWQHSIERGQAWSIQATSSQMLLPCMMESEYDIPAW